MLMACTWYKCSFELCLRCRTGSSMAMAMAMVVTIFSRLSHRNRLPLCFSRNSTAAYKAPPPRVSKMPKPLAGVIVKSKITTAHKTVKTCLTLAKERESGVRNVKARSNKELLPATLIARGPTRRLAWKLTTFKKNAKIPLDTSHIRKFAEAPSGITEKDEWKRWSCTRRSSPVKWANSIVWMNASGDRR